MDVDSHRLTHTIHACVRTHTHTYTHTYTIHSYFNSFRFNSSHNGLSLPVAFMGAPTIIIEKVLSGTETSTALEGIKKLLVSGVCDKANDFGKKSAGGLEVKQSTKYEGVYEAFGLDKINLPKDENELPVV